MERLDDFWDGDFTLRVTPPAAPTETPADGLGPAGIRIGGRDLAALLAETYRRLTPDQP